jgi:Rdx family
MLWDRKIDGGFPEAKVLKQRLRDHIDPDRSLGHSDTPSKTLVHHTSLTLTIKKPVDTETKEKEFEIDKSICEDCT